MKPQEPTRGILGFCLRLVKAVSRIVPAKWRDGWRQEWEAELEYRWQKLQEWNRATGRNQMNLLKRTLGAISDAAWLRQQFTLDLDVMQDIRYGLRMLRKNPGFTLVAVLTLALGIGANTAIFSIVHGVLLTPLPFQEPERLVMVWEKNYVRGRERNVVNPGNYLQWSERNTVFTQVAAFARFPLNLTGLGDPDRVQAGIISGNFFTTLGAPPLLGRTILPEDGRVGADNVIVLSHGYWQRRFGGDPDVLGRTLSVNGGPSAIIGVMPPDFSFPTGADFWVPQNFQNSQGRWLQVVARLKDSVTLEQAQAEMANLGRQLETERPEFNSGWNVNVFPLHRDLLGDTRTALLVLMGAVGLVLLIACANVANLLLVRAAKREKELSIRVALGAGRLRLLRQLLTESVLLAAVGGLAGILTAYVGLQSLLTVIPAEIPLFMEISLNPQVVFFALLITLATGVLFGIAPALQTTRPNIVETLKEGGRTSSVGSGRVSLRNFLVVAEVAIAMVLLAGAGLLVRSFLQLSTVDTGYNPEGILTMEMSLSGSMYDTSEKRTQFYRELLVQLEGLPEVESAGALSWLPLGSRGSGTSFYVNDRPRPAAGEEPVTNVWALEGNALQTLGVPLLRGRAFTEQEPPDGPYVVLVNQALAQQFWPDENPIGKRITMWWGEWEEAEIVGVVGDARLRNLATAPRATMYWPQAQLPYGFMTFMVRTEGDPAQLAPAVRSQVQTLDSNLPVAKIQTMQAVVTEELRQPRFTVLLLGFFAAVAVGLALLGVYGVISYSVSQRTHEIGLRMAMGASKADILKMVLGRGIILLAIGAGLGLAGAFMLSRYLESLLFNTTPTDPLTYAGVTLLLAIVALLACYIPARRATQVDPMVALRYE